MDTERHSEPKRARPQDVRFRRCGTADPVAESDKMDMIGRLAAGIAHEVRNPLTTVKGFLDILPDVSSEKRPAYLHLMRDEIERIELVVDELLVLAKPQACEAKSESLRELLADVIRLLKRQARSSRVHVKLWIETDPEEPRMVCVENQIRQIFAHLVKNAVEAMPQGGEVQVRLQRKGDQAVIQVIDRGSGMKEGVIERLGEPFFSTKESGVGLGIIICRRILAEYGGTLAFSSAPDAGTTVTVTLPCE